MIDRTVEDFGRVASEAQSIAAANEQQSEVIQEISAEVDEMNAPDVQSGL